MEVYKRYMQQGAVNSPKTNSPKQIDLNKYYEYISGQNPDVDISNLEEDLVNYATENNPQDWESFGQYLQVNRPRLYSQINSDDDQSIIKALNNADELKNLYNNFKQQKQMKRFGGINQNYMQQGGAMPQEQSAQQMPAQPQGQPTQPQQGGQQDPMQILQEMVMQYSQTMDPAMAEQIAQFLMQVFGIQPQGQGQAPVQPESQQGQLPQGAAPGQEQVPPPAMRRGGTMSNIQGVAPMTRPNNYGYTNRYAQGGYIKQSPTYSQQDSTQKFYQENKPKNEADRYTQSLMYPPVSRMLIAAHEARKNNNGII